jgi:hypothetical protein
MMRRVFWRYDHAWAAGWQRGDWWLSIAWHHRYAVYVDIGKVRIRWKGPAFRPLFSERSGRRKWHEVGRLGVNVIHSRKVNA